MPSAGRKMPLYPFMFVLPNGKLFDAGPDKVTRTLDLSTGHWTTVGNSPIDGHSAVMYRPGKILKSGTWADPDYVGIQSTNRAATIDFNVANPQWTEIAPMHHGRSYHTLTVLPDGKVFASGGMSETDGIDRSKAVFPTEIWDPDTGVWTEAAAHQRPREYHSSALLLQDGRVLLAGGGAFPPNAQDENSAEIYSPPYLFRGARPTITVAPTNVNLGTTFTVQTPDAASIDKVSLIRMGSVTHNFDMDQRFMYLNAHQDGANTLSVDAPTNRNVAIPGWYYLFINKANGVPSKGWIVKIDPPATDTQAPTAPSAATATSTDDHVDLSWNASTDNTAVTEYRVHRSTTAGFTPSAANRIATVSTGTTYRDNGLSPATYYYRVVAADAAGNASAASNEANATVTGDTTAPTVSVTAPAEAATVGGTVNVTANATDNRGVTSVQFKVDGANLGSADTSAPYTASWNTAPVSNGAHQITAVASDAAGNSATSAVIHVTVDNGSPPTVAVTAPAAGATVTGTINLTANATDDRGVSGVQFKVDGANAGAEDTSAPYSVSWDSRTVLNGARKITAVARDTDGNLVTSAEVNVNVSNATTGLVGAYGFEETTGTDTVDSSGGARTGTLNGPTRSLTGKFGSALSFDGINDWVTIPDANALDLTNAMTLEAWVRPSAISSWRTVLMKEQSGGLAYGLYANSNTNRPSAHITTSSEQDTRGTAQLALNTWTHLAVTYDGTTLRLFVNGVQASSKAIGGSIVTTTGVLRIGGNGVWPEWFAGLIDEVRLYNRVLTAAEVQADMNLAVVPPG
jgi:concanavalin A-like lectin/glucanase superfamily protein/galactose oxidase-like protein/Big-like domain-containing protein